MIGTRSVNKSPCTQILSFTVKLCVLASQLNAVGHSCQDCQKRDIVEAAFHVRNAFASAARPAVHDIVPTTIRVLNGQARLGYAIGGRT